MLSDHDDCLLREGAQGRLCALMGCVPGDSEATFSLRTPNARRGAVIDRLNTWDAARHPMTPRADGCGVREASAPGSQLDPRRSPAHVFRVRGRIRAERDFD